MQPIDPADPRRQYVQIAASIRAAILTGELEPGARLPSGQELARQFGVSRVTVLSALRKLSEEGFVRSRAGSGVYVTEEASLPVPEGTEHPLSGAAAFVYEAGKLKGLPRSGWFHLGIPLPETVGAHSFRAAIIGMMLASAADADATRVAAMCVFHDLHEARTGDLDAIARGYVTMHDPEAVTARQVAAVPDNTAKLIMELVAEFEAGETLEATLARDADKIELIASALEYEAQGYDAGPWREAALPTLRTDAGKQLAQAINATPPASWYLGHRAAYERQWLRQRGNDAYLSERPQ
jgi:putative hydrolases of HD superfamily